jgi:uncharacterized protein
MPAEGDGDREAIGRPATTRVSPFFVATKCAMFEWDPRKATLNLAKHDVSFEAVEDFDFASVIERIDDREEYGELRVIALGFIGVSLHVLVYAPQDNGVHRIISLRRASRSECKDYAKTTSQA